MLTCKATNTVHIILIVVSAFLLVSVELVDSALSLNGFVSSFASPAAQQNRAAFVFHSPTFVGPQQCNMLRVNTVENIRRHFVNIPPRTC